MPSPAETNPTDCAGVSCTLVGVAGSSDTDSATGVSTDTAWPDIEAGLDCSGAGAGNAGTFGIGDATAPAWSTGSNSGDAATPVETSAIAGASFFSRTSSAGSGASSPILGNFSISGAGSAMMAFPSEASGSVEGRSWTSSDFFITDLACELPITTGQDPVAERTVDQEPLTG